MPKCNNCKRDMKKETIINGLCGECRKQLKPTEAGMLEYLKEEDRKKLFGTDKKFKRCLNGKMQIVWLGKTLQRWIM